MAPRHSRILVRIREMILHGELSPGERVREQDLTRKLRVSSTPLRESLSILAQEGTLTRLDRRGFMVREFTSEEITDAIEVRGALEGLAARLLAEHGPPRRLIRTLQDCLREGDQILAKRHSLASDETRYGEMNRRFHSLLVQGAGSKVLVGAIERNNRIPFAAPSAIAFARIDFARTYDLLRDAHAQHHAIVGALEHGEGERVAALLSEHAYQTKSRVALARKT